MTTTAGKYAMRAVAKLTGLNPDTIRAWERRYGAIAPGRTEGSHRLYSEADVERLRLLRQATEAGHGIGRVANLPDDELRGLASPPGPADAGPAVGSEALGVPDRVLAFIERYDHQGADRELARVAALLTPRQVVLDVAWPLLREVGDRWCAGRLSVGQEHMASGLLRSLLGTLLRLADPPAGHPTMVLGTLSGERHELGVLMVALLAASRGIPVVFLGPDTPVAELATAARRTRAAVVGVSLVRVDDAAATVAALHELAAQLGPGTALWIGGRDAGGLPPADLPPAARRVLTLAELDAALDALAAKGGRA